jgi:hypothetical protein
MGGSCSPTQQGYDRLAVRLPNGVIADLDLPFSSFSSLHPAGDQSIVLVAGAATSERSLARLTLADGSAIESLDILRPPPDLDEVGVHASDVHPGTDRVSLQPGWRGSRALLSADQLGVRCSEW